MKTKEKTHLQFTLTLALSGLSVASLLFAIASLQQPMVSGVSVSPVTYYIDNSHPAADDTNAGTDQALPWKSLSKIATVSLKPGDTVLLKKGDTWNEKLVINASGSAGSPIKIGSYGSGTRPLIDGQDQLDYGIYLLDRDYVTINDIGVTRTNTTASAPSAGIVVANSNNVIIDGVEVNNAKGVGGIFIYSSLAGRGESNVIRNSVITNTSATAYSAAGNNKGNGIQLWADCPTCGRNNNVENNTISGSGDHGIGVFMPYTTIQNNTLKDNGQSGISASGNNANHTIIDGNTVSGNCQKTDDCFGINLFRAGASNTVKNNSISAQKDTINDSSIKPNDGYLGFKFGTGGIRFDGGDITLVNNPMFGIGGDYMSQTGNVISDNTISDEYEGIQVFNYDGVTVTNNTISNSTHWAINASASNSALGDVVPPLTLSIANNILMASWSGKSAVTVDSITKPITVTIQNQNDKIIGKGISTNKAIIIGDVVSTPTPTSTIDTIAPVLTLLGGTSINLTKGQSWVDPGYTVADTDLNPSVTITGSVNTSIVGTYILSYVARDAAGNQSQTVTRTVIVKDVVACTTAAYYRDADGDGYGSGTSQRLCPVNAVGYVTNNKDCSDATPKTCSSGRYSWQSCPNNCYRK